MSNENRYQKIIQYWNDDFEKEIPADELVKNFVHKYDYLVRRDDKKYYDFINKNKFDEKPKSEYQYDSAFYRDLHKMRDSGILKRRKKAGKSYYGLSEKYKIEPLKIWHKEVISKCFLKNVLPTNSIMFYLPSMSIDDFTFDELSTINKREIEIQGHFHQIQNIFDEVALRKANNIWKKYLEKQKCDSLVKFYGWLYLIEHKIQENTATRIFMSNMKNSYFIEELKRLADQPEKRLELIDNTSQLWDTRFDALFVSASERFLNSLKENSFASVITEWEKIKKTFDKTIEEMNTIILDSAFFMAATDSFNLDRIRLTSDKEKTVFPAKISSINDFNNQFQEALPEQKIEENTQSFFSESKFLEGFEKEIELLEVKKEKLYEELDRWAGVFYMPKIKWKRD